MVHPEGDQQTTANLEKLFAIQKATIQRLKVSTAEQRIIRLKKMQSYLLEHLDEAKNATYEDFRKPGVETILGEIFGLNGELNYTLRHLKRWMKPQRVGTPLSLLGTTGYIHYEAKGMALIIAPWNYPISLALKPLVSAIAAGCTAIVKPSEMTPHSAAFVRKLIEATFPPEEVAVVEGGAEVSKSLVKLPFNHIFFTGSPAIGKEVMKAAAENLASVTLELGGKSPCVIDETADIPSTARKVAWAKFLNNGQTCIAPDYLLVHHSVKESLMEEFGKALKEMYNEDGKGVETSRSYCRIVNDSHYRRLEAYLNEATEAGAQVVVGGKTNASDRFIEPTLLTNVNDSMKIMQEEIFGPLLPVREYRQLNEAIEYINNNEKPLALYIHSRNAKTIDHLLANTTAGDVVVNDLMLQYGNPEMPFGGINNSGIGKSNGYFGFQEFSNAKGVIKRRLGTLSFMHPPYTDKLMKLVDWAVKYV
jgi:aldehyde dehydrogenase (NAD+)